VPELAYLATLKVKRDVPEPVMVTVLNVTVTPFGSPLAESVTGVS
jgi:hypothetical protein